MLSRPAGFAWLTSVVMTLTAAGQSAAPSAFEVASIKPTDPSTLRLLPGGLSMEEHMQSIMGAGFMPLSGKHVLMRGRSLRNLIATAYRVTPNQVEGPDWLSSLRFDVEAKLPDDAPGETRNDMLRTLLEERFKLRTRKEHRDQPAFALLVDKGGPKLKVSAPTQNFPADMTIEERTAKLKAAVPKPTLPQSRVAGANISTYTGFTMEKLAATLVRYVDRPVVDATGLKGRYDYALDLSRAEESDDTFTLVARALDLLGLKLEARKIPLDVWVVDEVLKLPTPN